jgi:hydroxymethylpyrimidine kinase/phosphomethylpyrimidine kinase
MGRVARALSIAGSDSGGGAGIQADLKTFAALGVHGMTAITAITAQNTVGVTAVQAIEPEVVRAQIRAVVDDLGVDAAKTGMLYSSEIISVVAEEVARYHFPLVVDPVMVAKSGAPLLRPEAVDTLVKRLLPLATVLTPNRMEAEALSKIQIRSVEEARLAAKRIAEMGPRAVVVKGGHLNTGDRVVDVLYLDGEFREYEAPRLNTKNTHGTGCVFSSAVAAGLARGVSIPDAVATARSFVSDAIRFGLPIGSGFGPVDPVAQLHREAERYAVIDNLQRAVEMLEEAPSLASLVPESQINIGMALPGAASRSEVAAIPGRIVKLRNRVKASSPPAFGASEHIANTILAAITQDPEVRAAMNIRYSEAILDICRSMGLSISHYDRGEEPEEVKRVEGMTTRWGAEQAIRRAGRVPDIIYHRGDYGKEPMILLLGRTATEVAELSIRIARRLEG